MQVGIQSWSFRERYKEPGFDLFRALDETARMGFSAMEIMSGKAATNCGDFESFEPMYLDKVTRHARAVGVSICGLGSYNDFSYVTDEEWRLANVQYVKDQLKLAADLQIPNVRVMTGYLVEGEPVDKLEQLVIDGFRECAPVAEEVGVNMSLENHSSVMATGEGILRLIEEVGSERLTTCPDPTNFVHGVLRDGATDEMREQVYAETARIAPRATESHIKFNGLAEDGTWVGIDPVRIFSIYRDVGYDGVVAIESVYNEDLTGRLAEARVALEKAIAASSPP